MIVEGGLKGVLKEVLYRERFSEVSTPGLSGTRLVVQVDLALAKPNAIRRLRGNVDVSTVECQIAWRDGKIRLEEALVDRSELAYVEAREVDGAEAVSTLIDEQPKQARTEFKKPTRSCRPIFCAKLKVRSPSKAKAIWKPGT